MQREPETRQDADVGQREPLGSKFLCQHLGFVSFLVVWSEKRYETRLSSDHVATFKPKTFELGELWPENA